MHLTKQAAKGSFSRMKVLEDTTSCTTWMVCCRYLNVYLLVENAVLPLKTRNKEKPPFSCKKRDTQNKRSEEKPQKRPKKVIFLLTASRSKTSFQRRKRSGKHRPIGESSWIVLQRKCGFHVCVQHAPGKETADKTKGFLRKTHQRKTAGHSDGDKDV